MLVAIIRAYHANCEFDAALATVDAMEARPTTNRPSTLRGFYVPGRDRMCRGNYESGGGIYEKESIRAEPATGQLRHHSLVWSLMVVLDYTNPGPG